jgi:hypothetical protein
MFAMAPRVIEDEVVGVEVGTEAAGVDGAPHDGFDDRRQRRLLGVDVAPARLFGAEEREAERGVEFRRLQVAVEQRLERRPWVLDLLGGPRELGHHLEPAADDSSM